MSSAAARAAPSAASASVAASKPAWSSSRATSNDPSATARSASCIRALAAIGLNRVDSAVPTEVSAPLTASPKMPIDTSGAASQSCQRVRGDDGCSRSTRAASLGQRVVRSRASPRCSALKIGRCSALSILDPICASCRSSAGASASSLSRTFHNASTATTQKEN